MEARGKHRNCTKFLYEHLYGGMKSIICGILYITWKDELTASVDIIMSLANFDAHLASTYKNWIDHLMVIFF